MAESNNFAGNFLSLLDDFQAKRNVNRKDSNSKQTSKTENEDGESSRGKKDDDTNPGNVFKRKQTRTKGTRTSKDDLIDNTQAISTVNKNEDRKSKQTNKKYNEDGEFSRENGSGDKNPNKTFQRRQNMGTRTSKEEQLLNNDTLKSEENVSNQFLSLLDDFDNKLSLNKNQKLETQYQHKPIGTREERTDMINKNDSISKVRNTFERHPRSNINHETKTGFENTRKSCGEPDRESSNKNGSARKTHTSNNKTQEKKEPEIPQKRPIKIMSYKFLESLLDKETSSVLTTLASPRSGFQELVNERQIRPDLLMLIISVLGKINESEAHQLKVQILSNTFSPEFIDELKRFFSRTCVEDNHKRLLAMNTFFDNVLKVLDTVVNCIPSTMNDKMKSTLNALNLSMKSVKDEHKINVSEQLFVQLKELSNQVSSYIEHRTKIIKEQYHINKKDIPPPNNYRGIPLIPTDEDFKKDSYLRQNIVRGSYQDVDHYLDVQFRLLREDFIAPLREGILEYVVNLYTPQGKRKYSNVRIYPKVKFGNPVKSRDVFGFYIQFDCDKRLPRNINWEYNKRFMPGSLLLLSDNDFQSFYLATVVERNIENLKKSQLFIAFVPGTNVPEYLVNPGVFFVMAESEVYYEAYKHVLSALQRMNEKNFPMKQYIVDVDTTCFPPAYLVENSVYKISKFNINLLDDNCWPTPEELQLNPSQHQALKSALTNEFVVIQGPPGTGKTFLALKITEILLKNEVSHNTPIVVICYTNHALDQFLEGILKYTKNLIRIGMQSQNEVLQNYNLEKVRQKMKENRSINSSALFKETMIEKSRSQEKLLVAKENIEELNTPKGILDLHVLRSVIPPHHFNELSGKTNQLLNWLFCYDDPEFRTKVNEKLCKEVSEASKDKTPDAPEQLQKEARNADTPGNSENTSGIQEEEFEELDDEESARRLADMVDDDFYEEEFFDEDNYVSELIYSLSFEGIRADIIKIKQYVIDQTRYYEYDACARYYMEINCAEQINDLIWQGRVTEEQFSRFKDYRFNQEKYQMFQNASSVWEIEASDRWEYYATWVYLYICQLKQVVQHYTKMYQDVVTRLHEIRQLDDVRFVQSAAVVGLTTSGAAKRRVLLENLNTKIVIVEEAAEVLEAHIVTSLAPSVQHVILIGDHKQLKPNPAVFKLAKKYNMDCSLFERMLNNGLGCSVLNEQHRMRPEIASLITPTIYPHLANHHSTHDRPKVRGIDRFVFFLSHDKPEDQLPDSSSKQNKHEADILMELCKYLLLNDYKPEEITILATYTGQVWYMRKRKREMIQSCPDIRTVRITPVDNYQGEENRIILLSLVRSNKENKIGFLGTENRVCVALSRAKEGLYVVGNMDNLTNSSSIWPRIKQQLETINAFGQRLLLRCERHPEQLTQVSNVKDFKSVPEGGCSLKCKAELNCGHICPRVCHIIDMDHIVYKCKQECERLKDTNVRFQCYGNNTLIPEGVASVSVQYNGINAKLPLYVIDKDVSTIVGRDWINTLKIQLPPLSLNTISENLSTVKGEIGEKLDNLNAEQKALFSDVTGCVSNFTCKLQLKREAKPIFMKARQVPYALQAKIEEEIKRLQDEGIIEPVQFSEWATPVVPVVKATGSIRLCADYSKTVNPQIEVPTYPLPRVEEMFSQLSGSKTFAVMEIKSAYLHLPTDEDTAMMLTINTHKGLFRCKRMMFGVCKIHKLPCDVEGHKCPLKCWQNCEPCVIRVEKQLPCGHTAILKCHKEPAAHKCMKQVPAIHPACNHEITKPCFLDVNNCPCTNNCTIRLPCGHACTRKCHIRDDPDHIQYKCNKDCVKEFTGCRKKKHPCKKKCYEECGDCLEPMPTTLPCGHHHQIPCSQDLATVNCTRDCKKLMTCGHECKALCWVRCDPSKCTMLTDKKAKCGHIMKKIKCNEPTENRICKENCQRKLRCGHPCTDKCCNDCEKVVCKQIMDSPVQPLCGHPGIKLPCHLITSDLNGGSDELLQCCEHPCGKVMSCGHMCKGKCGDCLQGRLHIPCEELCNKTLFCGHKCKSKCGILCQRCTTRKCPIRCSHKKCVGGGSKNHHCYELCSDVCNKKCQWKCEHLECTRRCWEDCDRPPCYEPCPLPLACGHPCMGYCGEQCPKVCSVCDQNTPTKDRFVQLEDCKHIVTSKQMDLLVNDAFRNNIYRLIICPYEGCTEPIVNTLRYRSIFLKFRQQVVKFENTLLTEEIVRLQKLHALHSRLLASNTTVSHPLNMLMERCSHPFKSSNLDHKELWRLIMGILLQPLALRSVKLQTNQNKSNPNNLDQNEKIAISQVEEQKLSSRLKYMANALMKRNDQLSYEAILQIELLIVNILRLTASGKKAPFTLWFDVTPWTWEKDSRYNQQERMIPLSSTLRTRDGAKQLFQCIKNHFYISVNGEPCCICRDAEEENRQRIIEEEMRKITQQQTDNQSNQNQSNVGERGPTVTNWRRGRGRGRRGGRGNWRGRGRGGFN